MASSINRWDPQQSKSSKLRPLSGCYELVLHNPITTAELALLISIVSLVISLTLLMRDRHVVRPGAVAFGSRPTTNWNLSVTVMNSGKRAISVSHMTVRKPGMPGFSRTFLANGSSARIEEGGTPTTNIVPGDPVSRWGSGSPYGYKVYVEDALGKK